MRRITCAACSALLISMPDTDDEEGAIHRQFLTLRSRYRNSETVVLGGKEVRIRDRPMVCQRESCIDKIESDPATWRLARVKKGKRHREDFTKWVIEGCVAIGPVEPWEL